MSNLGLHYFWGWGHGGRYCLAEASDGPWQRKRPRHWPGSRSPWAHSSLRCTWSPPHLAFDKEAHRHPHCRHDRVIYIYIKTTIFYRVIYIKQQQFFLLNNNCITCKKDNIVLWDELKSNESMITIFFFPKLQNGFWIFESVYFYQFLICICLFWIFNIKV